MKIRTRSGPAPVVAVVLGLMVLVAAACSPGGPPQPDPSMSGSSSNGAHAAPPPTQFAPLAADATRGLDTGASDFVDAFAVSGDTVVAAGTVYGNRLAPTFRYSTDVGATWQLGGLSDAAAAATPPDQGDQTGFAAAATVDGATRWLVVGESWRQKLTWTSADGRTWERHALPLDRFPAQATFDGLTAVPEGFVLVGTDAADRSTAWTSADGIAWQARRLGGSGTPAAVASHGATVVAVGSDDDTYATWRSLDRGRTWSVTPTPPKAPDDDDFSRSLTDVTATDAGFLAIGQYSNGDWRPITYASPNGRSWRPTDGPLLAKGASGVGDAIAGGAGQVLAAVQEYGSHGQPRLLTRQRGSWRSARTPLQRSPGALDAGDWSVGDLVPSGDAWLFSAQLSRNGQVVSELWRSTDGGRTFVTVRHPDAELNQPVAQPMFVVRAGDETLVLGDSRRRSTVWSRSAAGAEFGAATLVSGRSSDRIIGAAARGQELLAYGTRSALGREAAVVWRRTGDRWVGTDDGTFSEKNNEYASSVIRSIGWFGDRWVAVGSTTRNGDLNASALVATSTDGRRWTPGRADRVWTKAGGDVWYDVTDLQGDHDRTRAMYGVTQVGKRLLAVGDAAEGKNAAAAVWTSDDAKTWTLRRLPLDGLRRSSMTAVASRGSTVVAIGTGVVSAGGPERFVTWQSTDGGRSWRQQVLDAKLGTDLPNLVALEHGFALTTDTVASDPGTSRPVLLVSDDGARWRERPLDQVPVGPGEGSTVPSALAAGDDLWLLVRTVNRYGSGTRLIVQPTR